MPDHYRWWRERYGWSRSTGSEWWVLQDRTDRTYAIMDADVFISLSHFKDTKQQAFGGPLKILVWVVEAVQERCRRCKWCRQSMQKSVDVIAVPKNVEVTQFICKAKVLWSIMIKCKGCGRCIGSAALMLSIIQTAVQTSCWTVRWQNMHRQSVMDARISISHWFRISVQTVIVTVRMMHRSFRILECLQADPVHWIRHVQMPVWRQHRLQTVSWVNIWQNRGWHCHHDRSKDSNPNIEWKATLDQAEKIGLGTREYELKRIK